MTIDRPTIIHETISEIEPYKPGTSKISGIKNPIKLSSNENPFGCSPKVLTAINNLSDKLHRYPDGNCTELRERIAKNYIIDQEMIVCGAGSDELIGLLCQAYAGPGDEVIYSQYGFLMYPISALRVGATPIMAPERNMRTDIESILSCVTEKTKIVFIANPNNPTGSYITKQEARKLRAGLPSNVLLVIDAAYAEYVTKEDFSTGIGMVELGDNTVMTRTFSKIYGLGGLRLGWAYCPDHIVGVLNRIRGPFNVSNIAQVAGIAALSDRAFTEKSRAHNDKWLAIMTKELTSIGLKIYPSVANFLLVEFPRKTASGKTKNDHSDKTAHLADKFLKNKGIIGRTMDSYNLPDCMRFTIGREDENEALLRVLTEFMK